MPTPADLSSPKPNGAALSSEEKLRLGWERYGNTIYFACGVVAIGILAKGGWNYLNDQKELGIRQEFAQCVAIDSFRNFAAKHPGHPLTGVAEVTIADNSYSTGKYPDAVASYTLAVSDLPVGPVQSRARLGLAMSLELNGKTAEAEADLRQLLNDPKLLKTIRCEAGYHLAGLAVASGRGADVQRLAEQLMQIDPTSPFSERTFSLRPAAPGVTVPALPSVTVPGKF